MVKKGLLSRPASGGATEATAAKSLCRPTTSGATGTVAAEFQGRPTSSGGATGIFGDWYPEEEPLQPFKREWTPMPEEDDGDFGTPEEGEDDDMGPHHDEGEADGSSDEDRRHVRTVEMERDPKPRWLTERYQLQRRWYNVLVNNLGGQRPQLELFADSRMHITDRWVGRGSTISEDAFQISWQYKRVGMIYCNPPFSRLHAVVKKMKMDKGYGIVVAPRWESKDWYKKLMEITVRKYTVAKENSVYEDDAGRRLSPPAWDTMGCLVDGSLQEMPQSWLQRDDTKTKSRRRRQMRKKRKQAPPGYSEVMAERK